MSKRETEIFLWRARSRLYRSRVLRVYSSILLLQHFCRCNKTRAFCCGTNFMFAHSAARNCARSPKRTANISPQKKKSTSARGPSVSFLPSTNKEKKLLSIVLTLYDCEQGTLSGCVFSKRMSVCLDPKSNTCICTDSTSGGVLFWQKSSFAGQVPRLRFDEGPGRLPHLLGVPCARPVRRLAGRTVIGSPFSAAVSFAVRRERRLGRK